MRALLLVAALAWSAGAYAQTVEELKRQVEERDAKIRELTEALKKQSEPEDDELGRALERTLVQQGALVLPARTYELQPQLGYAHWDSDRGPFHYEWEAALVFRAGLGSDWQVQAGLPYVHLATATGSSTDLSDVQLSVSKQLAREAGARPSVIASLSWIARAGRDGSSGEVPTSGGFDVLQGALTVVKRDDPLVYYGGVSYSAPQTRDIAGIRVEPGDTVGLRAGTALAATPHTSLNAGLNLGFVGASRLGGERVSDSDTVLGALELGFGTVLTRRTMLSVSGQFRVSGPVPNFRLVFAVPYRF